MAVLKDVPLTEYRLTAASAEALLARISAR